MLTVAALGSGLARYYLSLTASSYYTKAAEPKGYWYGLGAQEFGLSGYVQEEHLTRVCEGFDPHDGRKLVRNAGVEEGPRKRKHGDDLCFSAPKSVSVAWALASPELQDAIERAMHRAVRDSLDYIQQTCGLARVGAQGQTTSKVPLIFALFEHSSSRLGDPQLHVHAVCPNLTRHEDGRCTAIDSTNFYHHMMAGGALFRASLAQGMRELGFDIERDGSSFRLKGVDQDLCEKFSQRRAEIVEGILKAAGSLERLSDLDAREILQAASGRMAELVNLGTRRGKKEYTREEMFPIWRDIARSLGVQEHDILRLINEPKTLSPSEKRNEKELVFAKGVEKLTDEFSHFAERDLVRRVAEEAQGHGLNAREVRELVENKLSTQSVLKLGELVTEQRGQGKTTYRERSEERFTTQETLLREGSMLAAVERMGEKSRTVRGDIVEKAIDHASKQLAQKGHMFSDEQAQAVRHLTAGKGLIACMTGKAGTGKSTTLEACRLAWERAGLTVLGCALAGKAADGLRRSSGIEHCGTLASLLYRLDNGSTKSRFEPDPYQLGPNHVIVTDEAGMIGTKLMAALITHVERAGAKLVLVGDAKQLQAVAAAGGPFRSIAARVGECVLTKIIRQREEWRRDAVEKFSRGEAREALIAYVANKQLHVTQTRDEAIEGLVDRWKADRGVEAPQKVLLLASTTGEVRAINRKCQEERQAAGKLGEQRLFANGDFIHEHDRILLCKNSKQLGVQNGFTGEVVAVDAQRQVLTVRLDVDGREVALPLKQYGTSNVKLGYTMSVHKSQGETVENCHVLMGGHMSDLHLGYVQASRSRESTHLFIDQAHAGPGLKDAIRALSRDRSKDLARDIIDRPYKPERPAQEEPRKARDPVREREIQREQERQLAQVYDIGHSR